MVKKFLHPMLRLIEEDNLSRINGEEVSTSDAAFVAKINKTKKKPKQKVNIDELKKKTKCYVCHQIGHWFKECSHRKNLPNKSGNNDKNQSAVWCCVVRYHKTENSDTDFWYADSGASSHMTYHRKWFPEYHEYTDKYFVEIVDRKYLEIVGVGTILIEARVINQWELRCLKNVCLTSVLASPFEDLSNTDKFLFVKIVNLVR
ncbi:hypothetical protein QE152_g29002 [Popillia japonica]|uniref:Retrovirus-related Pol polyprotein from transposon TNT 1-94-like beta-barrel domain-containing protein n=1 Tax=Popillia japonica TaxID=7064 RepID=A0AAW1JJ00_POPJA